MSEPTAEICNICGHTMTRASSALLLGQHPVSYFSCAECWFFRTEKPYWLEQAYSQPIAATDTGIVLRNLRIARQLTCLLPHLFDSNACFLDVAGGTGLLTRLMRDNGFDFYWEDLHCQNVMAFGFEAPTDKQDFQAVTAFEALEHMEQPYEFIKDCVSRSASGTFIFTTELFTPPMPDSDWDYLAQTTGQHIAFFSLPTLQRIAQQMNLRLHSHQGLHLLTRIPLSEKTFRYVLDQESRGLYDYVMRDRRGFSHIDHEFMIRRALATGPVEPSRKLPPINDGTPGHSLRSPAVPGRLQFAANKFKRRVRRSLHKLIGPY